MFALMYKILPRVKIGWRDVWTGAAVTALLFTIGKFLVGMYLGRAGVASSFGAAGSLAVLLVWVYYSAQIFLLGAEFTWVYAHRIGSRQGQAKAETAMESVATERPSTGEVTPPARAPSSVGQTLPPEAGLRGALARFAALTGLAFGLGAAAGRLIEKRRSGAAMRWLHRF